jgi:hypothetical protein
LAPRRFQNVLALETYVVDEAGKTFTFQIDRATFPNWNGKISKRSFAVIGDELHFMDPNASAGGVATNLFERPRRPR